LYALYVYLWAYPMRCCYYKPFKFESMEAVLSREDALQLHCVLEEANRSYLKESQLNQKASFNILRVLSAYRLVCPDA
jgi:hypothetical protein